MEQPSNLKMSPIACVGSVVDHTDDMNLLKDLESNTHYLEEIRVSIKPDKDKTK